MSARKEGLDPRFYQRRERLVKGFQAAFFNLSEVQADIFRAGFMGGWLEAGGHDPRVAFVKPPPKRLRPYQR